MSAEQSAENDANRPNACCDYHRHIADGCCHCEQTSDRPTVGSLVRIVADEHPRMVGLTGAITEFGSDGTTAWVATGPMRGAWCSVSHLSVIPPAKGNSGGAS